MKKLLVNLFSVLFQPIQEEHHSFRRGPFDLHLRHFQVRGGKRELPFATDPLRVVESRQGAGTYVRDVSEMKRGSERQREARKLVLRMLQDAASVGVTPEEIEDAWQDEKRRRR